MYKWFLALRYLRTKLIALFGVAAVTLCVAMVLVVISVMGGFLDTIRARAKGLHSEIVLDGGSLQGFPYFDEFARRVAESCPDIVRLSTPVIYTYGLLRVPEAPLTKTARVFGIRLAEYAQLNDFNKGLQYNRFYPGTTHLGPQQIPVAGLVEDGVFRLPEELETAQARWRSQEPDASEVALYDKRPFERVPYPLMTTESDTWSYDPPPRIFSAALGSPNYADAALPGVIVGTDLLFRRNGDGAFNRFMARGCLVSLTLLSMTPGGNLSGEPSITVPLRYADDSRTGVFEIDSISAYVDFDMLQAKIAMDPQPLANGGFSPARTSQLLIGLRDGVDINVARSRLAAAWSDFQSELWPRLSPDDAGAIQHADVLTWEDLQRPFIAAVEKEKILVTVLFGLISLVAIVLIGCIFYMIVEKKTKDIGILKSLGASARGISGLFILYAAAVGVTGAVLGTCVGSLFVWNINGIQDFLASLNPELRIWSPEVYSFDRIPEVVKRSDIFWVGLLAVLSSMLGSLIPAAVAGRVWPVRALRYE